ncbi:MAG: hypothetical protein BM564_05105 [Bacteroidetes bacterium MedPE-SWsnd-G2]|nr:MAG: hypothetical protein BM564_05105 [Bacteroidetes bacterium MedPE-SWsnd-G2]
MRIYSKILVLFKFLIISSVGLAQNSDSTSIKKHRHLTDRFIGNVGIFIPSKSIKIKANGESPNQEIDFGKTFKLSEQQSTLAANFIWRFSKNKKWSVGLEYFAVQSTKSTTLEEEITWEDVTYPVGVTAEAGFGIDLYRLFFGRVISSGDKHEFSGGIGIHGLDMNAFIEGQGYIDDDNINLDLERKSAKFLAPVPNIGLAYFYAPTTKWLFAARIDWFAISLDEFDGSLWNIAPSIKYQAFNNFGISAGYRYFSTKLDVNKDILNGSVKLEYHGPLLSINFNF